MDTIRGRPRSTAVDTALAAAVGESLERVGYAAMSIEQVADSAGVAKATVDRRWSSKAEMVFSLVVHGDDIAPPADSGALAGDLRLLVAHVILLLSEPAARQALPGLLGDLQRDPVLAERFQATVIEAQRVVVSCVLQRAVARGEIGGADASAVHAQLLGTVFAWLHLVSDAPPADWPTASRQLSSLLSTQVTGRDGARGCLIVLRLPDSAQSVGRGGTRVGVVGVDRTPVEESA